MADLVISLHSQQGLDDSERFRSHQWAEIPDELSVVYMTGGLKRVRRMVETYCRYRFSPEASKWVRGTWHRGEPQFRMRYLRIPLVQLGRLRQTGTVDIYRGHMEILGGDMIAREAIESPEPWPADLPWVAPSAGEFDIKAERERPPYLGLFELRVHRRPTGCSLHLFTRDLPPVRHGLKAKLWARRWQPLTRTPNLQFLEADVRAVAERENHDVQFEIRDHEGVPEPLPPIRPAEATSPASPVETNPA
ncbi:MAG: hypothetical protein ACE5G2_01090 [Candidatus Krumholzibacteriia bacterium]